jgi:cytochrome c oxidase subunit 2
MWFDPHQPGIYSGQCAQFCGLEHAKMLLRVYVDPPAKFDAWIRSQQQPQSSGPVISGEKPSSATLPNAPPRDPGIANLQQASLDVSAHTGKQVFEQQACINCHTVRGTIANGRFGPDLTHLMSRDTLGAGIIKNTPENLRRWITDPNDFKPGTLMPAMHLTDQQNAQITAYLLTLH